MNYRIQSLVALTAALALVGCGEVAPHGGEGSRGRGCGLLRLEAGNAHRACGGFEQAARMLSLARQQLDRQHVTDPLVAAEVDSFLGSLYTDLRRLDDAENVLLRGLMLCRLAQDAEAAARMLIQLANVYYYMNDPSTAAETVQQALSLLGPRSEEQVYLGARLNLAQYLFSAGKLDEAHEILAWDAELFAGQTSFLKLRAEWLEARILMGREELPKAERLLTGVRAGFLETSPYDVAAVSIDLALLYYRQHRHRELREAVSHALNVLIAHQNVHRDALAAIQLLHQAAAEERLLRLGLEYPLIQPFGIFEIARAMELYRNPQCVLDAELGGQLGLLSRMHTGTRRRPR